MFLASCYQELDQPFRFLLLARLVLLAVLALARLALRLVLVRHVKAQNRLEPRQKSEAKPLCSARRSACWTFLLPTLVH